MERDFIGLLSANLRPERTCKAAPGTASLRIIVPCAVEALPASRSTLSGSLPVFSVRRECLRMFIAPNMALQRTRGLVSAPLPRFVGFSRRSSSGPAAARR